jgi:tetratricopeptide (TPR) repeat protein
MDDERDSPTLLATFHRVKVLVAVCVVLASATFITYREALRCDFVNFDDNVYVTQNTPVTAGLTQDGIVWAVRSMYASNWHPLTWISHMLDCQIYGLKPAGHHRTSLLLHAATAVVLLLVLRWMTGRLWCSALVAAIFSLHPLRVESVAWVAERKDVLSGLFFMLTLAAYAGYVRRPSWRRYLPVLLLYAVGLTAKPMLVTLPLVLLLLDYWPLGRFACGNGTVHPRAWLPLLREKVPLFLLAGVSGGVTIFAQRLALDMLEPVSWIWRTANALVCYVQYIVQMFYPVRLAVLYPHPGSHLPRGQVAAALVAMMTISAAALVARRKYPYFLVGWLWYLIMLLPVIGLLQVGAQQMADRYTYLPQIGLYLAIVWGVRDLTLAWPCRRLLCAALAAAVLAALVFCTWRQIGYWHNSETLWRHTLACTSNNALAHYNLGHYLGQQRRVDEEMDQYRAALRIRPNYTAAQYNLGVVLGSLGRTDEAIAQYEKTLQIDPHDIEAHCNLGASFYQKEKFAQAVAQWREALRLNSDLVPVLQPTAWILATSSDAALRNGPEALRLAQRAAKLGGKKDPLTLDTLAAAYAATGQFTEAVATAREALELAKQQRIYNLIQGLVHRIALYQSETPVYTAGPDAASGHDNY